jgi:hypothetical protein
MSEKFDVIEFRGLFGGYPSPSYPSDERSNEDTHSILYLACDKQ